jgi:hypothetical protein
MTDKNPQKIPKFICEICQYTTGNKKDFNKHILTDKHSILTKYLQKSPKIPSDDENIFLCDCGKKYKHRQSLYTHKQKCIGDKNNNCPNKDIVDIVLELVKSNGDLQKQMLDVCKNTSSTTTNSNNNNCNNKTFNLQLFLNETCKNAMNIMEFVDSIKFQLSDLESVGELGYVNGLSKIIIRNLKALDENMRPVHCSDLKREKIYIKDADKWEKEGADNKILKNAIKYIAHKNVKMIPFFREKYPDCVYSDSRKSDQYNNLIIEAMGGLGNDEDGKANKIIKKIVKEILIDKSPN